MSSELPGPRLEDFPAGAEFEVAAGDEIVQLAVSKTESLADSGRQGGSFRIELTGPAEPLLPQATYRFRRGDAGFEIFIVPVARDPDGVRYEAIFC